MSKYMSIIPFDDTNSQGYSLTIFFSKCSHRCKGCHNPLTWEDSELSKDFNLNVQEQVFNHYKENENYYDALVLSGGDPMHKDNVDDVFDFVKRFKGLFPNKEIWLYTGYTIKEVDGDDKKKQLMNLCDYIKCGRYIEELTCSDNIMFGIKLATSNQKIYKRV